MMIRMLSIVSLILAAQLYSVISCRAESLDADAFVRVSPRDSRYFELSNGKPYIPIGLNMICPPGKDFSGMEKWLQELEANQGNFIRVWLGTKFFDVEAVTSGEYDLEKAKVIAQMLASTRKHGIRVKMCLEYFRNLGEVQVDTWAAKPLHLKANGGPADNTADFFKSAVCQEQFKRKLAWYESQFGSNPTIFGWELWNEFNTVHGGGSMQWTELMLSELHRLFPKNLAMQSLGSFDALKMKDSYRALTPMPGNDVAQVHRYLDCGAALPVCHGPVHLLAVDAVNELLSLQPGKPVLLAESGAVEPRHVRSFKLYPKDTEGMILHDVLFAPFFAGAAGPGHIWHWDEYVAKNKLWYHFGRFAKAVRGLDPPAEHFQPNVLKHDQLYVAVLQGQSTCLIWCRDSNNDWRSELQDGIPPETLSGIKLDLTELDGIPTTAQVKFYDPWNDTVKPGVISGSTIVLPDFKRSLVVKILRDN